LNKVQAAIDELAALGSVEAIAEHLKGLGVQARCGDPNRCAVADYLVAKFVNDPEVLNDRFRVSVGPYDSDVTGIGDKGWLVAEHPPVVSDFIRAFDNVRFPELVDPDNLAEIREESA